MVEWRPVHITELTDLYSVSDTGLVRSSRSGRIMRPSAKRDDGRLRLVLYDLKHRRYYEDVHKLVARAFVPGETDEKRFACHRNGVPTDNLATNLYWGTPRDNSLDRSRHGTNHNRVKTHCPRGHLLESPNLQAAKLRLGFRSCKA